MKNGKYQKQDITALQKSIAHWEKDNVGKERVSAVRIGVEACALCIIYWVPAPEASCRGCPVWEKTKMPGCKGSPYVKAARLFESWREKDEKPKTFEKAVAREIAFLEDLLEEAELELKPQ